MDHIVYLNTADEIQQLSSGEKTVLARASMGKKRPYDKVSAGDMVFFTSGFHPKVKAMASVKSAVSSQIEEKVSLGIRKMYEKMLAPGPLRELTNKRYVILVELENVRPIVPFALSEDIHGSPGDWVIVENIDDAIC
jgi:hypothetical protein